MSPRIDAHTHLFPPALGASRAEIVIRDATFAEMYADPKAKMASLDQLLLAMAEAQLEGAVCAGFAFARQREIEEQNAYLLQSAGESAGRLFPLATINLVHAGWRTSAEGALKSGARGFGELRPHNQGWDPLGCAAHELCELAADANAVLLWHVSEPLGHTYPGKHGGVTPLELARLAAAHPLTKMIAAHLGGGLSFYLQIPEVRESLRNVWFDTAAAFLLYDSESVSRLVGLAGQERVLFASDFPLLSPRRQLELIESSLPGGTAEAVCGGNAKTLFSDTHGQ
jgi:predicted TIM-barrel fold metal-dependent hydrolase